MTTRCRPLFAALCALLLTTIAYADQNTTQVSQFSVGADTCTETLDKEGDLVAIARRHDGCALIDVSDAENPSTVAVIEPDPTTQDIWDVDLHDGYLYLMNRPEGVDTNLQNWVGLYIYDVAGPGPPAMVGYLLWGGGAWHHLAGSVKSGTVAEVNGSTYAFLCSDITGSVEIFDTSIPAAPVYVSTVYLQYATAWDTRVENNRLFTAWGDDGFTIHDLASVALPLQQVHQPYLGSPVINGGVRTIAPTPDGTHVVTGEYTNAGHVRLWEIAALPTPSSPPSWQLSSGALLWTVRTTNEFAYVAHLEDGIQVLDIRDRGQLKLVGCFDPDPGAPTTTWAGIADVEIVGGRLYASHQTKGLYVVDFGDEVNITKADWKRRENQLIIYATSSAQPNATLEVFGFGQMTWKSKKNRYELKASGVASNPGTVVVFSDLNGSDTRTVRTR